jgi:uncharacterized membrane protein
LTYHHDEAVGVRNPEVVLLISELLRVKQETLLQALTAKRARASGETLVINYRLPEVSNLSGNSTTFGLADFCSHHGILWFINNVIRRKLKKITAECCKSLAS